MSGPGAVPRTRARPRGRSTTAARGDEQENPNVERRLAAADQGSGAGQGETAAGAAAANASPGEEAPANYSSRQIIEILIGLMLAMLTSMLTTSIVGTALPTIVGELGGQDRLSWVASATLLTMTASTPVWGKLSDVWGRKLLFQIALVIFIGSSVAAGFATDMTWLIAARFVQGIGTGGLAALPQIILGDVVAPRERGRYSGFLGSVFGVATVGGPLLGGFLVDSPLGWRWCFFITVPLAVVAFIVIQRLLKLPVRPRTENRIDWWGATCIVGAEIGRASCRERAERSERDDGGEAQEEAR